VLVETDGRTLAPSKVSFAPICANFPSQLHLTAGDAVSGCVAFQVGSTVGVTNVQFLPTGGTADNNDEWLIPQS
jgi:hypothetical protein